jgi:hypothetical protein
VTIGGDGQHTYLIHTRNSDGSFTKALMVEDGYRLAERYSERIAFKDALYAALHGVLINVRIPSGAA